MIGLLCWVTGARREELLQVLYSFSALLFLLMSYYLIKPLRNSQFLSEFDPKYLPFLYLVIPLLSFIVTKVFNFFVDRMDKYQLIIRAYLLIMVMKVAFTWILQYGGKPATVIFFLWGSVYFLLALPTLWACFNDFFAPQQGERLFGFVQLGATLGGIVGSLLSGYISRMDAIKPYATIISASSMGVALIFLVLASKLKQEFEAVSISEKVEVERSFWSDLIGLIKIRYVRSIAIMVTCLACFTTSLDFLSQKLIDQKMSYKQYQETFPDLEAKTGQEGYQFVYGLKSMSKDEAAKAWEKYAMEHDVHDFQRRYDEYKSSVEGKIRAVLSDVSTWQGLVGMFMLVVVARLVFRYLGLRIAVSILPAFALLALVLFSFPLEILLVEAILVFSGSFNYALNNATKEILYSATSEETKFKHKPLIEGPFMRLGDITASILKLGTGALALAMAWHGDSGDRIFLGITFALVLIWWKAIYYAGNTYDKQRASFSDSTEG